MKSHQKIILVLLLLALIILAIFFYQSANRRQSPPSSPETKTPTEVITSTPKNNPAAIQQQYQKLQQQAETKQTEFQVDDLLDSNQQPIPLIDFLQASKIQIRPEIYRELSQTSYKVFFCAANSANTARGIRVDLAPGPSLQTFEQVQAGLDHWQAAAFRDLSGLLFPNLTISEDQPVTSGGADYITQNGIDEIKIYYLAGQTQTGQQLYLDYAFFNGQIFLTNDKECLKNALDHFQNEGTP